jgi:hypothetical protein
VLGDRDVDRTNENKPTAALNQCLKGNAVAERLSDKPSPIACARAATVLRAEDNFGVAIDYADHKRSAYVVRTREQAQDEAVEIRRRRTIVPE